MDCKKAQAALAPSGKFQEWCLAYGLKYSTVQNRLSLAKQAESKLAVTDVVTDPLLKRGRSQLVMQFKSDEERSTMIAGLRDVLKAPEGLETDDWTCAVRCLLNFWYEHKTDETDETETEDGA